MRRVGVICGVTIVVAATALFVWWSIPTTPPDILLITVDTLRADALEPYGAIETKTPNIARFADRGVVYDAATTPIPLTRPAHASILTGLYPDQHGVLKNRQILPEEVVTLAEALRDVGYQTAGFTGVRFLNKKSGLEQGFVDFEAPKDKTETPRARQVVGRAIEWLGTASPESPVLLWVHIYDPHQPYSPPKEYLGGIDPDLKRRFPKIVWAGLNRESKKNGGDVPPEVLELALDYYRGEVEYTDHWIGRLIDAFDRARASRRSMVVFTADHGECFENGIYFEHSDCLFEGALRVPLIVRFPKHAGAGRRVGHRVSILDITPTVLDSLSLPIPEGIAGLPLERESSTAQDRFILFRPPVWNPDRTPFRLRFIRSVAGDPVIPATDQRTRGVIDLEWKYLWTPDSEQLFKLPNERSDRASTDTEIRARMLEALKAETVRYPPGGTSVEDMDPETLEALEALGYVQ
jgi:arylsulfatase A-like enzyme